MQGASIALDIKGLPEIARAARAISELGDLPLNELAETLGAVGVSQTQARIASGGPGPDGEEWAPLSDGYKDKKAAQSSGGLLSFGGFLFASLSSEASGAGVEWGSNLDYAAIHQFGDDGSEIKVASHIRIISQAFGENLPFPVAVTVAGFTRQQNTPARPYLGVSADNAEEIEATALEFVKGFLPEYGQ
jgi:phage gpG-like protein